ncbi:Cuticle protein 19.8 [Gryllus bimaculatus]|nr:Cuticle protein 19.8 [Gryllus bimaculatus]
MVTLITVHLINESDWLHVHRVTLRRHSRASDALPVAWLLEPLAHAPAVLQATLLLCAVAARTALAKPGYPHHAVDYYAHPRYAFNYGVHDAVTGDVKSQSEHRDGDVVKGQYSLVEPDGSVRTVDYTADPVNGFNAVVHKTPGVHATAHVVKAAAVAPVVKQHIAYEAAAPIAAPVAAPVALAKTAHVQYAPAPAHTAYADYDLAYDVAPAGYLETGPVQYPASAAAPAHAGYAYY